VFLGVLQDLIQWRFCLYLILAFVAAVDITTKVYQRFGAKVYHPKGAFVADVI